VPDVLVNNAGLSRGVEKTDDVALENFEAVIDTNVKGLFYATRIVLKGMRQRGDGHIVNIGSVGWMCPFPGGNHYAASKAAVHALTQAFRSDTMGTRIRVSEILPGMVETEFSEVRFGGDEERAASAYKGVTPLTGEDIADAVFYCVNVPAHVNVESLVIFPQQQILGPAVVTRDA
jgi:serine 3-dehydrogenase